MTDTRQRDGPGVLVVAPARSYRLHAYQCAARALGLRMVVASQGEHGIVPPGVSGIAVDLERAVESPQSLLAALRRERIGGVVATDDDTVELASRCAAALGCPHNPVSAVRLSRRKDLARSRLRERGAATPWFLILRLDAPLEPQLDGVDYPCVVKPVSASGSRGVIRCDDVGALLRAVERVRPIAAERADPLERALLLIEGFLPGREIAIEAILSGGVLRVLAVFDKPDPLDGPYFQETYYVTPSRLEPRLVAAAIARVEEAVQAYGLREGPVHAELRVHGDDATVLEVAARTIGGECARLLTFSTGRTLEELVLANAVGTPLETTSLSDAAAGVLMIPIEAAGTLRRVEGVLDAKRVPLVEDVVISVREGYELVPPPEGGSYLGFVFARGASADGVEQALRDAHAKLRVIVAPAWRIGAGGSGAGRP